MKKTYTISVRLLSPMHINGGTAPDGRRTMVKHDGRAYIPATLFKGVVRGNFTMLLKTFGLSDNTAERFFGGEGFKKSRVIFDNLEYEGEAVTELRTNVSINRYSGKAFDGALVNSEVQPAVCKNGEPVCFTGEMTVYYSDDDMMKYEKLLLKSVELIDSLGSGKSRGLGFTEVSAVEKAG